MELLLTAAYIFLRGFKRAYRWRGLYPRGLFTGNKKSASKKAIAVQIKTYTLSGRFAFTDV